MICFKRTRNTLWCSTPVGIVPEHSINPSQMNNLEKILKKTFVSRSTETNPFKFPTITLMQALPKQCTTPRYDYESTGVLLPSTMLLFRSLEISLKKNSTYFCRLSSVVLFNTPMRDVPQFPWVWKCSHILSSDGPSVCHKKKSAIYFRQLLFRISFYGS